MGRKEFIATADHSSRGSVAISGAAQVRAAAEPAFASGSIGPGSGGRAAVRPKSSEQSPLDFERIYEDHFDFVWRSLRLLGVAPAFVEDVAQDTFDVVLRQLDRFEGRSSVRTWLFAIAQRVAANHRRTARRKLEPLRAFTDVVSGDPTPHAHAEASEAAGVVQRFVADLTPELRTLFVLAVLEEVPAREVAQTLRISVNAVYCRIHALRNDLRRAFELHEGQS